MGLITTTADFNRIGDYGSDHGIYKVITDLTGAGSDTFSPMPIRESFEITPNFSTNTKTSEGGTETTTKTKQSYTFKYVHQQVGKIELQDFPTLVWSKLLLIVLELNNEPIADKYHYVGLIGKLTKLSPIKGSVSPEWEFACYKAASAITVALTDTIFPAAAATLGTTGTNLIIPKDSYYGMVEVATS